MARAVELILLIHTGRSPNITEIGDVGRDVASLGYEVEGAAIRPVGFNRAPGDVDTDLGLAVVARLESKGELSANALQRTAVHEIGADENRAILAIVAREPAPAKRSRGLFGRRGSGGSVR